MSGHRIAAITRRLLQQFRHDHRTLALLFVAPLVILGLLGYLIRGGASAPDVGIANEDLGPVGATVATALEKSSKIHAVTINAADGTVYNITAATPRPAFNGRMIRLRATVSDKLSACLQGIVLDRIRWTPVRQKCAN